MAKPKHSTKHDYQPAIMLYVDDWLESPDLKLVSLAAQGLWIHLLCRMWKSPKRGCLLKANGKQPQPREIGVWVGVAEAEVKQLLSELGAEEVYSTLEDGTIYCRRMLRSVKQKLSKRQAGKLGGEASARSRKRSKTPSPISNSNSSSPLNCFPGGGEVWGELEEKISPAAMAQIRKDYPEAKVLSAWEWTKAQDAAHKMTGSYLACLRWALKNNKKLKPPTQAPAPVKSKRRCPFCKFGTDRDGDACQRCDGHGMILGITDKNYKALCEEAVGYLGQFGTFVPPAPGEPEGPSDPLVSEQPPKPQQRDLPELV